MTVTSPPETSSVDAVLDPYRHRGEYGLDGDFEHVPAPVQAAGVIGLVLGLIAAGGYSLAVGRPLRGAAATAAGSLVIGTVASYTYATRTGKFAVWADLLTGLRLRGDERLLDLGCGRGAVLLTAAKLLPRGRATGVDVWRPDQSGNSIDATLQNARLEEVADRVDVESADITRLPFPDATFDVVVSNLVLHNIPSPQGRRAAIVEAARVLRPGGRLLIADLLFTRRYAEWMREQGLTRVERRNLGWRLWFGGPWFPVHAVTAVR